MTIIYPSPVFGPVKSRRLGVSLGVNLLPGDGKVCTFDCIYCECGLNAEHRPQQPLPSREEVAAALESRLRAMAAEGVTPDVITFAGNGEPTCHPDFAAIIDDTIRLRDLLCPQAKISVLTNATNLHRESVFDALCRVDNNIGKIDTVNLDYIRRVDRPVRADYNIKGIVDGLRRFAESGHRCIVQTMFMGGTDSDGNSVDNTSDAMVAPWIEALKEIRPAKVMIYTIDRETPVATLRKASPETLDAIAKRVREAGLECSVSY